MSAIAIITARGGSKRIPKKNIREFCGKPIIAYSIEAALSSGLFETVMVSTDSQEIAAAARKFGAQVPFMRSAANADDYASMADVLLEVLTEYKKRGRTFDEFCCIYPTAPFVTAEKLRSSHQMLSDPEVCNVVSMAPFSFPPQRGMIRKGNYLVPASPDCMGSRSQDLEQVLHDCGQFYWCKTADFFENQNVLFHKTVPFLVSEMEVQDIDNEEDWRIAEMKYTYAKGLQQRKEKLAVEGGTPVRTEKIYYGRQWIGEDDIEAAAEVLRSSFITCGPKVEEMERTLEAYTGAKYAVAVSNGTAALHCACMAAGIGPGDEVITTPLTFAASANCVLYCGAKPVFADVDPYTYNISPESIRSCITEKTKAVIAVDFTGQAVRHQEIREICKAHHLVFIEDAAHGIATKYNGKQIGSLADLTTFSFHPVKTITGGEGGAVLTNQEEYQKKLLLARTHGITHEKMQMEEETERDPWYYEQVALGYNYRITDFQAALIVSQMKKLDRFAARRKEIAAAYEEAFSKLPELILQKEIPESDTCRHLYIIRLDLDKLRCSRREFFDAMSGENVQCQVHYIPVYWFPYYQRLGYEKGLCPNAEEIYQGIMSIPLYPAMTDQDVQDVIHAVKKVTEHYRG